MATTTEEYLEYLDQQISIAPANSQEELDASVCLERLFKLHDVETDVQEFDMPSAYPMVKGIVEVLLFAGVLLSGFTTTPVVIPSVLVAIAAGALLISDALGYKVLSSIGPKGKSQNVIGYHPKTGDLATKGSRPIVIVAHYDTPRESVLARPEIARFQGIVKRLAYVLVPVATVLALIQLVFGATSLARRILWLIALVATLPGGFLGVAAIMDSVSACTIGANDNKSSVAALLGVLEAVRPTTGKLELARPAEPTTYGVRHGAEVIAAMGMLPEDCEVVYVDDAPEEPVAPAPEDEAEVEAVDVAPEEPEEEPLMGDGDDSGFSAIDPDPDATAPVSLGERPTPPSPEDPAWGSTDFRPNPDNVARRASLFDLPDPSVSTTDPLDAGMPETPVIPAPVRLDGEAKTTVFRSIPKVEEGPAVAPAPRAEERTEAKRSLFFGRKRKQQDESMSEWLGVDADFDAKEDGRNIGSWDHFNDDEDGTWKGGAALDPSLRPLDHADEQDGLLVDHDIVMGEVFADEGLALPEDEEVLGVEDLQEAILEMDDDALVAHDIWFVALGASSLDHAGMKAFLADYRKACRGAFVINLDSVGAGQLTAITAEGVHNRRKADRRMLRLFSNTARDLHIELAQAGHTWGDTDATPAMRSSMRSVTIMGMGETNTPALSGTPQDLMENVDAEQVSAVARLVTELIRRS